MQELSPRLLNCPGAPYVGVKPMWFCGLVAANRTGGGQMREAPETLLRLPEVLRRTGLSRASLYRQIAANHFPSQVKISARASAWSEQAVQGWITSILNVAV